MTEIVPVSAKAATVAMIGGKKYSSLQKAFNAAKNKQTIKLMKNVTLKEELTLKRKVSVTLNLNKKKIVSSKFSYPYNIMAVNLKMFVLSIMEPSTCREEPLY